jgi:ATP-dependent HslUV protease ATP-binding subunit HslU
MKTENVTVSFTRDAIDALAQFAFDQNKKIQNIGARRLYTILERVTEELSFHAPDVGHAQHVRITAEYVRQRLADVVKDEDLSRYIL